MAKRPPTGKCVHCLKYSDNLTWDHVFPQAWYPDTTPPNLEKWKIPSCPRCNKEYGKLEEDLLWRLGLSVDPKNQKSLGITARVLRSTKPIYAKNERDRKLRSAKLKSIVKQLMFFRNPPQDGILPNFGPQPNLQYDQYVTIPIDEESLVKLGRKIIRGTTYLFNKSFIDNQYAINVYLIEDHKAQEVVKLIETYGETRHRGAGVVVKYAMSDEGGLSSLWLIEIWGRLKLYGVVLRKQGPIQQTT